MKRLVTGLVVVIACLATISNTYALSVEDNGYTWNATDVSIRIGLCKVISSRIGKDYVFWFSALNEVYDTTNPAVLKMTIQYTVAFIGAMESN